MHVFELEYSPTHRRRPEKWLNLNIMTHTVQSTDSYSCKIVYLKHFKAVKIDLSLENMILFRRPPNLLKLIEN